MLFVLNGVVVLVLIAWLIDSSFVNDLSFTLKMMLALIVVCFELSRWGAGQHIFFGLGKILVLNLGFVKLNVKNLKALMIMALGLVMCIFPLSMCIYTGIVTILLAYYGREQS